MKQIIEKMLNNVKGRDVILWGKCKESEKLEKILKEKYNVMVAYYIDSDMRIVDGVKVNLPKKLEGNRKRSFVVCILPYYEEIYKTLNHFGYKENKDFIYYAHKPIIVSEDDKIDYVDQYGNKIIGDARGVEITFHGYNATLKMGKQCSINKQVSISLHNNARIKLGDNVIIHKEQEWVVENYGVITIGHHVRFEKDGIMYCGNRANITIGEESSLGRRYWVNADNEGEIYIGKECLVAHDVVIRTNDGHDIFTIENRENISNKRVELKQNQVIIDEHVWVGTKAVVLYGSKIGKGSIVGASSVVKKHYPNNCIIAGVPAKVIKKNIVWSKQNNVQDISVIDEKYINCTVE